MTRRARAQPIVEAGNASIAISPPADGLEVSINTSVAALAEIWRLFGFVGPTSRDESVLAKRWLSLCRENKIHPKKVRKYKTAAFFSAWAHVEDLEFMPSIPPAPFPQPDNPAWIFGGKMGRWVQYFKAHSTDKMFYEFIVSVLYAKKGMPRPTSREVKEEERSTFSKLTNFVDKLRPAPFFVPWSEAVDMHPALHLSASEYAIRSYARRAVNSLFSEQFIANEVTIQPFIPSFSAQYNNTRSALGAFGFLYDNNYLNYSPIEQSTTLQFSVSPPEEAREGALGPRGETVRLKKQSVEEIRTDFHDAYRRAFRDSITEPPLAELLGLPESEKVRVISKGPALTYFVLKPIQKFLHDTMRRHPIFQLIGAPVTEESLDKFFGRRSLRTFESWLSVDYSDATNGLDPRVSQIIAEEICDRIFTANDKALFKPLIIRALVGHVISFGDEVAEQKHGQLMGSIVSFPVLCIANLIVLWWAHELSANRLLPLPELKVLINGDDALTRGSPFLIRMWKQIASSVGLEPSVGKVYVSRVFCNINSTTFFTPRIYDQSTESVTQKWGAIFESGFVLIPYVNLGLLYGMKRSTGPVGRTDVFDEFSNLGTRHHELHRLTPPRLWDGVNKIFLRRHWELLKSINLPWYVPQVYGGLGLFGSPSKKDCVIVRAMVNGYGPKCSFVKSPQMTEIHRRAVEQLPGGFPTRYRRVKPDDDPSLREFLRILYAYIVYSRPQLVKSNIETSCRDYLRQNERVWRWYLRNYRKFGAMGPWTKVSEDLSTGQMVVSLAVLHPLVQVPENSYVLG